MANLNIPATKDRTLDAFKGRMVGGGARPNLFECEMYFPDDAVPSTTSKDALSDKVRFLVKAAQLPASTLTQIDVPFRGRQLKIAGTRTYANWSITVINDQWHKNSVSRLIRIMTACSLTNSLLKARSTAQPENET